MKDAFSTASIVSPVRRYGTKTIFVIALAWTFFDFLFFLQRQLSGLLPAKYSAKGVNLTKEILLRELNVFVISLIIGYFLVVVLKNYLRNSSLWYNLFIKTLLLILAAFFMNFFIYVTYEC